MNILWGFSSIPDRSARHTTRFLFLSEYSTASYRHCHLRRGFIKRGSNIPRSLRCLLAMQIPGDTLIPEHHAEQSFRVEKSRIVDDYLAHWVLGHLLLCRDQSPTENVVMLLSSHSFHTPCIHPCLGLCPDSHLCKRIISSLLAYILHFSKDLHQTPWLLDTVSSLVSLLANFCLSTDIRMTSGGKEKGGSC